MVVALALAAAVSQPAPFQDDELLVALAALQALPGAWAEYLVRSGGEPASRVRVTALAAPQGRYWLEVAAVGPAGIAGAARILVRGGAPFFGIERMFVTIAGQQPIEIPLDRLHPARRTSPGPPRRVGAARVQVRAGTFDAEVLAVGGARLWRASGVPLWGVVKAQSRGISIELVAAGEKGGHSVFPAAWVESAAAPQGNGSESEK